VDELTPVEIVVDDQMVERAAEAIAREFVLALDHQWELETTYWTRIAKRALEAGLMQG
jgi:hypothetical protein